MRRCDGTEERARLVFRGNCVVPVHNPFRPPPAPADGGAEGDGRRDGDASGSIVSLCDGLEIRLDHVLVVSPEGFIEHFEHSSSDESQNFLAVSAGNNRSSLGAKLVKLSPLEFLCPGFIDTHIHAPQYTYAGTATDRPLMGEDGWLETYTFPAEMSLASDLAKARSVYDQVVRATLNSGTTTAVYFATLHLEPTKVLVDAALERGQRALVGKVCMDRNGPEGYVQSVEENVKETEALIGYIRKVAGREKEEERPNTEVQWIERKSKTALPLVLPVVTPRFIPTCTPRLLSSLGELAAKHGCHIQSHISESVDEVDFSRHLDATADGGGGRTDALIFDSHGLLTDRCIMAHGVHLNESDRELLHRRGAAVAHCPLSNFFFAGGSLPARKMLEDGNRVGLGTDVAGGYNPSMMESARMACVASRSLHHFSSKNVVLTTKAKKEMADSGDEDYNKDVIDYRHAFYLATLGGAETLGLADCIGTFKVGMEFDAVILSAEISTKSRVCIWIEDTIQDVFQKLCNLGDDRNIKSVYVQGKEVKSHLS